MSLGCRRDPGRLGSLGLMLGREPRDGRTSGFGFLDGTMTRSLHGLFFCRCPCQRGILGGPLGAHFFGRICLGTTLCRGALAGEPDQFGFLFDTDRRRRGKLGGRPLPFGRCSQSRLLLLDLRLDIGCGAALGRQSCRLLLICLCGACGWRGCAALRLPLGDGARCIRRGYRQSLAGDSKLPALALGLHQSS